MHLCRRQCDRQAFFHQEWREPLTERMKSGLDGSMPSGDAVAASALLRLFSFTRDQLYYDCPGGTLRAVGGGVLDLDVS